MRHAVILALLIAVLFALVYGRIGADPFAYDEADYMYAASLGLAANYTDTPTKYFAGFLRDGLNRGQDAGQRMALSEAIRASNDVNFYRHWHGPFPFYWWIAGRAAGFDEHGMRASMLAFHIVTLLVIYFGCLWILPGLRGQLAAALCSALYAFSYPLVRTSVEVSPHMAFVFCFVTALLLLAKAVQTGQRSYWRAGLVTSALAFCTLEVALVLLATYVVFAGLERKRFFPDWPLSRTLRWLGVSALLFAAAVVVLWPGALLKQAFLKGYAIMAYLALYRKAPWGHVTLFDTWWIRIRNSPVEWIFIAFGLIAFLRKPLRIALPFLIFAALMILATLRVSTDSPRYSTPFLPALLVFAGLSIASLIAEFDARTRIALTAAACLLLFADSYRQALAHGIGPDVHSIAMISWLREHPLDGRRVLVPQTDLPTIHYYFPGIKLRSWADDTELAAALRDGGIDGILYTRGTIRLRSSE